MKAIGTGILIMGFIMLMFGLILANYTETYAYGLIQTQPYAEVGGLLMVFGILMIIVGGIVAAVGSSTDKTTQPQIQIYQVPSGYYPPQYPQQGYYQPQPQYYPPIQPQQTYYQPPAQYYQQPPQYPR
jgi:uncharacterized membrane protein